MEEVRDINTLNKIRMQIPHLTQDVYSPIQLYKAWEDVFNYEDGHNTWYYVDLAIGQGMPLRGMLDSSRGILYLDATALLILVQERIDSAISTFNAGHWPYKGL